MSYLVALDTSTNPPTYREVLCDSSGALVVSGTVSGGTSGGSGLTDTQLRASPVPVSANTLPLPAGAATAAKQDVAAASLASIDGKTPALVGGAVPVSGPVTDAQLRATPVNVNAATRACVGRETIVLAAGGTASLTVPVGAVAAHIQADGASIRIRLDGQAPTATVGTRLDDGVIYPVDSTLAGVRLYGVGACNVQVVYFDRA